MLYKRWCKTAEIKKYKHEHYISLDIYIWLLRTD